MIKVANIKGKGRGIITSSHIKKGSLVELSPIIETGKYVNVLENYLYEFGKNNYCVAFGFGSLFNHSVNPNMWFSALIKKRQIAFYARRNILPKEELTIDYGYETDWE
jgi:hypothetical protein